MKTFLAVALTVLLNGCAVADLSPQCVGAAKCVAAKEQAIRFALSPKAG